tara:strand:- start:3674 stop:3877 length:204 start_codon:yes stop_codon:yes gene_type:complete
MTKDKYGNRLHLAFFIETIRKIELELAIAFKSSGQDPLEVYQAVEILEESLKLLNETQECDCEPKCT